MSFIQVFALEGIQGVGKTTLMKKLAKEKHQNYQVIMMDESFIPSPRSFFHPQSFYLESVWAINWFKRLEKVCGPYFDKSSQTFCGKDVVIIADRSPFSACIYARDSDTRSLKEVICECVAQFIRKGIRITVCYMENEKDVILERVRKRLKEEKWRKKLDDEQDEKRFDMLLNRYERLTKGINCFKINDKISLKELIDYDMNDSIKWALSDPKTQKFVLRVWPEKTECKSLEG